MLRVTIQGRQVLTLKLEGKISGSWTLVLNECWRRARLAASPDLVQVDLTGVTFVDEDGRGLLRKMAESGTRLVATDPLIPMLVDVDGIQIVKQSGGTAASLEMRHCTHGEEQQ